MKNPFGTRKSETANFAKLSAFPPTASNVRSAERRGIKGCGSAVDDFMGELDAIQTWWFEFYLNVPRVGKIVIP